MSTFALTTDPYDILPHTPEWSRLWGLLTRSERLFLESSYDLDIPATAIIATLNRREPGAVSNAAE